MLRFYAPILLLQGFCLYHAYKNNTQQKWFWLIIIFPLVGSLIYLYYHFSGKINIDNITEGVKEALDSNYKMEKLEKENRFADTAANKIKLGDQYMQKERYKDALEMYESCLNGIYDDDPELMRKLLQANYMSGNYEQTINFGEKLENDYGFKNSNERIALAWAYFHNHGKEIAEKTFKAMDMQFANYPNRIEYCKFLLKENRTEEAKNKLATMIEEIEHMDSYERKMKRGIQGEIKKMYEGIE